MTLIHNDEVFDWINKTGRFSLEEKVEPKLEPELFKCPKSDKCVMDCYHKDPHEYEEKYCNGMDGHCHTKCVHELISDCTFFKEDFEIK
jgi:hypothetical protein